MKIIGPDIFLAERLLIINGDTKEDKFLFQNDGILKNITDLKFVCAEKYQENTNLSIGDNDIEFLIEKNIDCLDYYLVIVLSLDILKGVLYEKIINTLYDTIHTTVTALMNNGAPIRSDSLYPGNIVKWIVELIAEKDALRQLPDIIGLKSIVDQAVSEYIYCEDMSVCYLECVSKQRVYLVSKINPTSRLLVWWYNRRKSLSNKDNSVILARYNPFLENVTDLQINNKKLHVYIYRALLTNRLTNK